MEPIAAPPLVHVVRAFGEERLLGTEGVQCNTNARVDVADVALAA
jgi:hypothetical protein